MPENLKPDFVLSTEWPTCATCIYFDGEHCRFKSPAEYFRLDMIEPNEIVGETSPSHIDPTYWCGQWVYIGKLKDEHNRVIINAVQFSQQVWKHRANQIQLMNERARSGVH